MRRREPLDPVVRDELDALDAALSGAPGADPALTALVADVRAAAPRPDAGARARLDERILPAQMAGVRHQRRARRPFGMRLTRRALVPAGGVLAAALVALVVALGAGSGARDDSGGGVASSPGAAEQAAPAGSVARDATAPAPSDRAGGGSGAVAPVPPVAGVAPGVAAPSAPPQSPGRRVERSVRLELGAAAARFDAVTDAVVRTTQRAGGHVASSGIARGGSTGTASFVLRIPVPRLDAAVADLSRLAHVRGIEQATQDLTGAFDGTAARLDDARAQRRALVAAVATATGDQAARLRSRLAAATARVRRLERQARSLRNRTTYATVDLTVTAVRRTAGGAAPDDRWTPGDAWRDARRGLEVAAGVLILLLAFALPVGLAGAVAAVAARTLRRRRRDAALDAA